MRKIPVEDLKPGMIFDKPVYVDKNNILVGANTALQEADIKKLMMWGVQDIETEGDLINTDAVSHSKSSSSASDNEKRIVADYNDLVKKRKRLLDIHSRSRGAVASAYECIRKMEPFEISDLERSVDDIIAILKENSNVFLFLYGLDEGKDYLVMHSVNVAFYALIMGLALNYNPTQLRDLGVGTLLIDAGMTKIPVYIIHKQSNLTDQEFKQIKTHPLHGYKAIKQLAQVSENIANISLQHQEQFDGKGYPRGLKGNEITEFARIAAIADSYEAQISNRSWRGKVDFYHSMRNLLAGGVNKFDPVILRVFLSRMSVYPIGSIVELNDHSVGLVIGSAPEKPLRPIVKLIFDEKRDRVKDTIIVNLLDKSSFYITRVFNEKEVGISIFDVL